MAPARLAPGRGDHEVAERGAPEGEPSAFAALSLISAAYRAAVYEAAAADERQACAAACAGWAQRGRGGATPSRLLSGPSATAAAGLLGLLTQSLLARTLSVEGFATFGLSIALLQFVALFFEFGLFVPASRLAARAGGEERRRIVGAALVAYVPVGLAFSLAIAALSLVVDDLFTINAGTALRVASVAAFAVPFVFVGQQLAQGAHRLHIASAGALIAQATMFAGIVAIVATDDDPSATSAVLLRVLTLLGASLLVALWLRPLFAELGAWTRIFVAQSRQYRFGIYVGRVLSVGTFNSTC